VGHQSCSCLQHQSAFAPPETKPSFQFARPAWQSKGFEVEAWPAAAAVVLEPAAAAALGAAAAAAGAVVVEQPMLACLQHQSALSGGQALSAWDSTWQLYFMKVVDGGGGI
jgi:hypothetical protein